MSWRRSPLVLVVMAVVTLATPLALAAGRADAAVASQAATSGWSLQTVPPVSEESGTLTAISCGGPRACMAVGNYTAGQTGDQATLAQAWNGHSWSIVRTPNPGPSFGTVLSAVSCPSPVFCVAAGTWTNSVGQSYPLAERWQGGRWSISAMANPVTSTQTVLTGVACTSAAACIAVGYFANPYFTQTLAEAWNGHRWSVQRTPNVPNPTSSVWGQLNGIWCVSAKACTAVGDYEGTVTQSTLAESWNGTTWSIKATPNLPGEPGNALNSVSCRSARQCLAVGEYTTKANNAGPLAEAWNGKAWSVQKTPAPKGTQNSYLYGAFCPSALVCLAVGSAAAGDTSRTLAEQWNGHTWSVKSAPSPAGSAQLLGIWCLSARACVAVGSASSGIVTTTLAQTWTGSAWSITKTPNLLEPQASVLNGVSCTADQCMAVGDYANPAGTRPLTELWNGKAWSIVPSPSPAGTQGASLAGVSCVTADDCVAVGTSFIGAGNTTLAEAWNGKAWSIAPTPNPSGAQASFLSAVSCPTAGQCTAVGYYATSDVTDTLAETWSSKGWSISKTPNAPGSGYTTLTGVSCPAVNKCVAVGGYTTAPSPLAIAQTWNGSSWAIKTLPSPAGAAGTFPQAVSCTSATACTAVGNYYNGANNVPLAQSLTGTTWSVKAVSAPASAFYSSLNAVSCPAAGNCVATGYSTRPTTIANNTTTTLAAAWNGVGWTLQAPPNPSGAQQSYLLGVSCPQPGVCTGIGYYSTSLSALTVPLAARYS
jgi:hypothetical protein